jgi:hypothetical protein
MIMVLNQKGEIMISRQYRDDVSRVAADSFRIQVRLTLLFGSPVSCAAACFGAYLMCL